MKQLGRIEASSSEWSSPLVTVPKKDWSLQISVDFHKLNAQSEFDAYNMPRIDDVLERIGQAQYTLIPVVSITVIWVMLIPLE